MTYKPHLPDELWRAVEPLLPAPPAGTGAGRPRVSDRAVLTGIIFILKAGLPWNRLPPELECGSGMTCWRRWQAWQQAGCWPRVQRVLAARLRDDTALAWLQPALDAAAPPPNRAERLRRARRLRASRHAMIPSPGGASL